ncbi:hypothetical protein OIO90_001490 [Microbotryomycetes sp. JL221]|nr:hypothetical protein OIO90_001490 [Microbotryomycetes sp. JL221]
MTIKRLIRRSVTTTDAAASAAAAANIKSGSPTESLVLRPIIPGVTQPLSALPLMLFALVGASVFHELGHAMAAVVESVPIISTGMHLVVALPTFYVNLAAEKQSLRILGAGIWHNLALVIVVWLLSSSGGRVGNIVALPFFESVKNGLAVVSVVQTSPLHPFLPPRSVITHLDDVELDSASKPIEVWNWYLSLAPNTTGMATYESMGWCLPRSEFTSTHPECCITESPLVSSTSHELCFAINDNLESSRVQKACLDPMPLFYPSSNIPTRCLEDSGCEPDLACATLSRREMVLRIGVAPTARENSGRTVVWQGRKQTILHQGGSKIVNLNLLLPADASTPHSDRYRHFATNAMDTTQSATNVGGLRTVSSRLSTKVLPEDETLKTSPTRQLSSLSLVLAFFNSLPLPLLDGSHILSTFLSEIANPYSSSREEGLGIVVEAEPGLLSGFMDRCRQIGWIKTLAKRRDKVCHRIKLWTVIVVAILLVTTVVVEWKG